MDKQMKDRFAAVLDVDPSAVSAQYWLKVIATLLFYWIRTSK
jgi:hypothetical protein